MSHFAHRDPIGFFARTNAAFVWASLSTQWLCLAGSWACEAVELIEPEVESSEVRRAQFGRSILTKLTSLLT